MHSRSTLAPRPSTQWRWRSEYGPSWQLACEVLPVEPPPVDVGPLRECSWSYDIVNSAMAASGCGVHGGGRDV